MQDFDLLWFGCCPSVGGFGSGFTLNVRHQGPFGGWGGYSILAYSVGLCGSVMFSSIGVQLWHSLFSHWVPGWLSKKDLVFFYGNMGWLHGHGYRYVFLLGRLLFHK
ncbi:hypothetical protein CIPAW_15G070200 [Carya illinoinensis]|uniref:Uncharacterized protein n=1 Tax=Carya illinoinensis TaxID=32201 RepID=A0A8T1N4Y5_CARIL|nr:hypothetical protein CIPAW_15G070200 [Carya illinoinensis]